MAGAEQPSAGTAARSDDEVLALAKEHVGAHFGLSAAQSARLRGATRAEIKADAKAMRAELGLEPLDDERERDEQGRYRGQSMNDVIRQAAGR
jgi:hypothetical protein